MCYSYDISPAVHVDVELDAKKGQLAGFLGKCTELVLDNGESDGLAAT